MKCAYCDREWRWRQETYNKCYRCRYEDLADAYRSLRASVDWRRGALYAALIFGLGVLAGWTLL